MAPSHPSRHARRSEPEERERAGASGGGSCRGDATSALRHGRGAHIRARTPDRTTWLLAQVPGLETLYARWVDVGRNVGLMTARTGKLLELYGPDVLANAVADVLACGLHDPGALAVRCEQARRAAGAPMPVLLELGTCRVVRRAVGGDAASPPGVPSGLGSPVSCAGEPPSGGAPSCEPPASEDEWPPSVGEVAGLTNV